MIAKTIYEVAVAAGEAEPQIFQIELLRDGASALISCTVNGESIAIDALRVEPSVLSLLVGGISYEAHRTGNGESSQISIGGETFAAMVRDPRSLRGRRGKGASTAGPKKITAPMPGKVGRVLAPEGTHVKQGEGVIVIVIEAMKMQNELKSPKAGVVKRINAAEGATVNAGDSLAIIE